MSEVLQKLDNFSVLNDYTIGEKKFRPEENSPFYLQEIIFKCSTNERQLYLKRVELLLQISMGYFYDRITYHLDTLINGKEPDHFDFKFERKDWVFKLHVHGLFNFSSGIDKGNERFESNFSKLIEKFQIRGLV
jgi:hypothetical protein